MYYSIKQRKSRTGGYRLLSLRVKLKDGSLDHALNIKVKEGTYNPSDKSIKGDLYSTMRLHSILEVVERVKLSLFAEGTHYLTKEFFKERLLSALTEKGLTNDDSQTPTKPQNRLLTDLIKEFYTSKLKSSLMKQSTAVTYERLLAKVEDYDESWDIKDTSQESLKLFRYFLINKDLSIATINLMLVRLGTVLKYYNQFEGTLDPKILTSPFLKKMKEIKQKRVYLSLEEIARIYKLEIGDPLLSKARDLLLIGCYTALRVSDWEIRPTDISEDKSVLVYRTQKTGSIVNIPLFPELKKVLERNEWRSPVLKEHTINQLFRQVCKMADITRKVKNYKLYPDRTEEVEDEAWKFVTSHTCRRSFATNMYLEGMPTSQIRVYTGHANDKVFMNYVQASDTEVSKQVKLENLKNIFNNEKH